MKISASLFSRKSKWTAYASELEFAGVDYIHIDYLEGTTAPIEISSLIPPITRIPYDIHMISGELQEATLCAANQTSAAYFCIQYENLRDKRDVQKLALFNGFHGIAFTIDTPMDVIEQYISYMDFILIMCSTPGVSGGKFQEKNIERIRVLKEKYPGLPIHVDGGIDGDRIVEMERLGVSLCVSGSYLSSTEGMDLICRVCDLKFRNPDIRVADLMSLRKNIIPILETEDFYEILHNVNQSRMGAAFVENEKKQFLGIITDGDIRRAMLVYRENVFSLRVRDIMNTNAYCVNREKRLSEVFLERMVLQKPISVIPVLEAGGLVGVLDLKKYF